MLLISDSANMISAMQDANKFIALQHFLESCVSQSGNNLPISGSAFLMIILTFLKFWYAQALPKA